MTSLDPQPAMRKADARNSHAADSRYEAKDLPLRHFALQPPLENVSVASTTFAPRNAVSH